MEKDRVRWCVWWCVMTRCECYVCVSLGVRRVRRVCCVCRGRVVASDGDVVGYALMCLLLRWGHHPQPCLQQFRHTSPPSACFTSPPLFPGSVLVVSHTRAVPAQCSHIGNSCGLQLRVALAQSVQRVIPPLLVDPTHQPISMASGNAFARHRLSSRFAPRLCPIIAAPSAHHHGGQGTHKGSG